MVTPEHLERIAVWARDLAPAESEEARRGIVVRSFTKGSHIWHQGDEFNYWIGVVSGLAKLSAVTHCGQQLSLTAFTPGAWFGEESILKHGRRQHDLVALRDTRLALMDSSTFNRLFNRSVGFNRFLVLKLNERLQQSIGQLEADRGLPAAARIAQTLASVCNPRHNPSAGPLQLTQEEIGQLSGVSRQTTSQSLKALEAAGVLKTMSSTVAVQDWQALARYGA